LEAKRGVNTKAVYGTTKINTTVLTNNVKVRAAFQYKKDFPSAEQHNLIQAWNEAEDDFEIWDNTNDIPNQGDFTETAIQNDTYSVR